MTFKPNLGTLTIRNRRKTRGFPTSLDFEQHYWLIAVGQPLNWPLRRMIALFRSFFPFVPITHCALLKLFVLPNRHNYVDSDFNLCSTKTVYHVVAIILVHMHTFILLLNKTKRKSTSWMSELFPFAIIAQRLKNGSYFLWVNLNHKSEAWFESGTIAALLWPIEREKDREQEKTSWNFVLVCSKRPNWIWNAQNSSFNDEVISMKKASGKIQEWDEDVN